MISESKPKASSALRLSGALVKLHDVAAHMERGSSLAEALIATDLTESAYRRMLQRHGAICRNDDGRSELQDRFSYRAMRLISQMGGTGSCRAEHLADPATTDVGECWTFARHLVSGRIARDEMRQVSNLVLEAGRQQKTCQWLDRAVPPLSMIGGQWATSSPLFARVVWLSTVRLPCSVLAGADEVTQSFKLFDRILDLIDRSAYSRPIPAFSAPIKGQDANSRGVAYAPWFWAVAAFLGPVRPLALRRQAQPFRPGWSTWLS